MVHYVYVQGYVVRMSCQQYNLYAYIGNKTFSVGIHGKAGMRIILFGKCFSLYAI